MRRSISPVITSGSVPKSRAFEMTPLIAYLLLFATGAVCGVVIHKFRLPPYRLAQRAYHGLKHSRAPSHGPFSIGIYAGPTLFDLAAPEGLENPVLTGKDVTDMDARFVADPFLVRENGRYVMFFEALERETNQGVIAYADSADGLHWQYGSRVLAEPFHLSYPYVFPWNNEYYMIPESFQDLSVRLYRASEFPDRWEFAGRLLSGYPYVDPSILRHDKKWWLFVTLPQSDMLNLYFSDDLLTGWRPHPMNPIVRSDKHFARPGGRVIRHDGRIYRLTQDTYPAYGIQVFAFEILELTEESYREKMAADKPVVARSGRGWNAAGMHHVDAFRAEDVFLAAVDGKSG